VIRHVSDLRAGEVLRADVGVVGAGFAGIDLARHLTRHGLRVVLLEAGELEFDPETQALTRIESVGKPVRFPDPEGGFTPYLAPIYRGETRLRQLGGTSNIWTGKWRMFDPIDFVERPWIPHSGWPIGLNDLRSWYEAIAREYPQADFDAHERSGAISRLREALAPAGLTVSFHHWETTAFRPARRFRSELEQTPGLTVLLGASATEIVLEDDLRSVEAIVFRSLDGLESRLTADRFVLATGGLEAARLLLASNRQVPAGIGNAHDLVGRFYMDHPKHKRGIFQPGPAWKRVGKLAISNPRPCFIVSFSLTEELQRQQALPNHAIYFHPKSRYKLDYPAEHIRRIRDARALGPRQALGPAWALMRSPRALQSILNRRILRRRGGPIAHCTISMYLEQVPNPDSRVYLGSERDALGLPKLVVDWRLTQSEHEAFDRLLRIFVDSCARARLGTLEFGALSLDDTVDAAHPMGTTRMAESPAKGVVDPDCKVFGTENLFVASSSVFPTGHTAAPTMTILALARRLGAHLVELAAAEKPVSVPAGARAGSV
jgi:choline dehydrogenase-like flavoprotein